MFKFAYFSLARTCHMATPDCKRNWKFMYFSNQFECRECQRKRSLEWICSVQVYRFYRMETQGLLHLKCLSKTLYDIQDSDPKLSETRGSQGQQSLCPPLTVLFLQLVMCDISEIYICSHLFLSWKFIESRCPIR